jgi:hypothetical protein
LNSKRTLDWGVGNSNGLFIPVSVLFSILEKRRRFGREIVEKELF